jgi:hypothetical protein
MDVQSNRAKFNSRLGNIERMVEFENLLTAKDGYKKSAREEKNFSYLSFPSTSLSRFVLFFNGGDGSSYTGCSQVSIYLALLYIMVFRDA